MEAKADLQPKKFVVNKAELFKRACEINLMRRQGQLPIRNTYDLMRGEESRLAWIHYTRVVEFYQDVYEDLRRQVRQESIAAKNGEDISLSAGGRWLLDWKAIKRFEQFLEAKGHVRPMLRGIPYGSGDKS